MKSSKSFISLALVIACGTVTTDAFVTPSVGKSFKQVSIDSMLQSFKVGGGSETRNVEDCHISASSTTDRATFLSTMGTIGMMLMQATPPANAAYGDTSNIELPNYIEFLIEKNTTPDQSKILYKGADIEVQIKRISDAAGRLNEIPNIAKEKKWSQVQGILTGPLGTLVQTMNSLCKDTDGSEAAKKAAAKVKGDIILISQEAAKKNEGGVVKACEMAQKDLESFAKLVF